MTLLEIIAAAILLLIATIIILNIRKKNSEEVSQPKASEQVTQESIANTEPVLKPQPEEAPVASAPELEPAIIAIQPTVEQATIFAPENTGSFPQDSILRRHYLTHVINMIESLSPPPTESVLCRHYTTITAEKIAQCLSSTQAMEQLVADYENNKSEIHVEPSVQPQVNEPAVSAPETSSHIPEDSVLRRHYLTHLCSLIESISPRPSESVLCRHYNTALAEKLAQCLNSKEITEQLIHDYELQKS